MTRSRRTRRHRLLHMYRRGLREMTTILQKELDATRASFEHELASLRAEVRQLRDERTRAENIFCALDTEREYGARLQ
jgi:succinate dehydrogenase flavin-adding protein (antitoxin of CptAB toxin-antitoxin module)